MSNSLFIADLHLSAQHPKTTQQFLSFLKYEARHADHLYILGDLFDVWIGDDNQADPIPEVKNALADLSHYGTQLSIQHGNRDFLLGSDFCSETHAHLLNEFYPITLANKDCLLMHGDLLCSDDTAYQQARVLLRSPKFIANFLAKSLEERAQIAAQYRVQSGENTSLLAQDIMDVNVDTLIDYFQSFKVDTIIHGHTHRPKIHSYHLNNELKKRYVLPDWGDDKSGFLNIDQQGEFILHSNA